MVTESRAQSGALPDVLGSLHQRMVRLESERAALLQGLEGPARESGRNLLHYAALRNIDLRPLQPRLAAEGLSSLGRCEPWALGSVRAVWRASAALAGERFDEPGEPCLASREGWALLEQRTNNLFGPPPGDRGVRMMVTMPDAAAEDGGFIRGCLEHGMDAMRVNTSAGDAGAWLAMVEHLRAGEREVGRRCRAFADLGGPKIRLTRLWNGQAEKDRVRLERGDRLRIAFEEGVGPEAKRVTMWAEPRGILARVRAGDPIWFNDGKVGARADAVADGVIEATVTFTRPGGQKLRVTKGINLPDTPFEADALTQADREALRALWGKADAFGLSFVRTPGDVRAMREACLALREELGGDLPGIVLKIETKTGFQRLPELLLELLRWPVGGVMLARGDLAVECGFERMAEIQEELLCFCEAAHVPVIWATEVLGTLAKEGRPTRAEITDAAAAQRAECVMLNKGSEIPSALTTLADILRRMQGHQRKKSAMFRELSIAGFGAG